MKLSEKFNCIHRDVEKDLLIEAFWITLAATRESVLPGEIPRTSGQARRHSKGSPTCSECSVTELEWWGRLHCALPVCNTAARRDGTVVPASLCLAVAALQPPAHTVPQFSIKCNLKEKACLNPPFATLWSLEEVWQYLRLVFS